MLVLILVIEILLVSVVDGDVLVHILWRVNTFQFIIPIIYSPFLLLLSLLSI